MTEIVRGAPAALAVEPAVAVGQAAAVGPDGAATLKPVRVKELVPAEERRPADRPDSRVVKRVGKTI